MRPHQVVKRRKVFEESPRFKSCYSIANNLNDSCHKRYWFMQITKGCKTIWNRYGCWAIECFCNGTRIRHFDGGNKSVQRTTTTKKLLKSSKNVFENS